MVFSRLLAHESTLGVDIGSSSIKIVSAEPTKYGARITSVAMCPTPPDSVKEGVVVQIPDVAAALQFCMRSAGVKASSTVAAIAGPGVIVRHVSMPRMTEQILRKSIGYEASKLISASIEDSVIEFQILGDAEEGQMDVLIVAVPKAMIDSRLAVLEQAGLSPLAVDIEAFATFRALIEHNPDDSLRTGTVALLDVGASHTEINLVVNGKLELTRTIQVAGRSLTNAIKNAENCSDDEAEQKKFEFDLKDLTDSPSNYTPPPGLKVMQSLIDEILREIRRSINYYQSQLPDGAGETTVDRLIFTGGTSRLKGLLPYASSRLNVNVNMGTPVSGELAGVPSLNEEDLPLFTVAFGLATKENPVVARAIAA